MSFSRHPDAAGLPITARKIVTCARCEGRGHFTRERVVNHHKDERIRTRVPCTCCRGSGRMRLETRLTPFEPETETEK